MQNPDWLAQCVESITRPKPIITPELLLAGLAFLVSVVSVGVSVFFYIDKQRKDSVDETRRIRLSVFTILFLTPQLINLKEFFSEFDRVLCALPDGIVSLSVRKQVNEALLAGQEKLNGEFVDLLTAFDRELYNSISKKIEAMVDASTKVLLDTTPVPTGETIKKTLRQQVRKTNAEVLGEFYQFDPAK